MHDHISFAYNSKRSTGMKLTLVSFESYSVEDFMVSGNLCLFAYLIYFYYFQ